MVLAELGLLYLSRKNDAAPAYKVCGLAVKRFAQLRGSRGERKMMELHGTVRKEKLALEIVV